MEGIIKFNWELMLVLCIIDTTKRGEVVPLHTVKAFGCVEVWFHSFLTLVLVGDEW